MNIKRILLAFTLTSLVATLPIMAALESNNRVGQAESAFKTFKKDIKCAFSREGCTREQRIRMAKRGLKLLGAVALLYGFLKFRAKVMAKDTLKASNKQMRQEEKADAEKAERERPALEVRIKKREQEQAQQERVRRVQEEKRELEKKEQMHQKEEQLRAQHRKKEKVLIKKRDEALQETTVLSEQLELTEKLYSSKLTQPAESYVKPLARDTLLREHEALSEKYAQARKKREQIQRKLDQLQADHREKEHAFWFKIRGFRRPLEK